MSWQRRPSLPAVAPALTALPLDSITENDSSYLLAMDVDLAMQPGRIHGSRGRARTGPLRARCGLAFPEPPVITRHYRASDRVEVRIT